MCRFKKEKSMKKLMSLVLCALVLFSACSQKGPDIEVRPSGNNIAVENLIGLLKLDDVVVNAQCPLARETFNSKVTVTPDFLKQIADAFSQEQFVPTKIVSVPGGGQELTMSIGGDGSVALHIYPLPEENKALIWLQNGQISSQFYAELSFYDKLKQVFDSFVTDSQPQITGKFIEAQLPAGRDIVKGFAQSGNVLVSAYSGYDKQGYVDFYNIKTGELLNSIILADGVNRLDIGKNGVVRVFQDNIIHYINMKKYALDETKKYELPIKNVQQGDNFDVDEKQKAIAYVLDGNVYLADLKGENATLIMDEAHVKNSLTEAVIKSLDQNNAKIYYKTPRFIKDGIVATATTQMSDYPLVALTSCVLNEPPPTTEEAPKDNTDSKPEKAKEVQAKSVKEMEIKEKIYQVLNFPGIFGKTGVLRGYDENKVYVESEGYAVFANATSGEETQIRIASNEKILPIEKGGLCELVNEQVENGFLQNIYVCLVENPQEKQNILTALNSSVTLEGTVKDAVILKDTQNSRLMFVAVPEL